MKIVFFGDSLTWGRYGGNFVAEVAKRLPDHDVINAGVGGDTVVNLLERVDDDVLSHEPDGIFILIGGNDVYSYSQPNMRGYYRRSKQIHDGVVTPELYARSYRALLEKLQLSHCLIWIGLPPVEYSPTLVAAQKQYNAIANDIARSMNIPTLDLLTALTPNNVPERPDLDIRVIQMIGQRGKSGWSDYENERQKGGFTYSFDGTHLLPSTAERIAEMIVDFIDL